MAGKILVRNIPDALWQRVKARAAARRMTVSKAVEEALEAWLEKPAPAPGRFLWRGIANLGASGEAGIADMHDRHLARRCSP